MAGSNLSQEIAALLASLGANAGDIIPEAAALPAVASQDAQSSRPAPAPQTLGPQRGEPRPITREEWLANFGQGAGSMAASAADPLGIPSALLGTVAPGARDAWRQYQGAAGAGPQIAGSLLGGLGAANAMFRGGQALGRMAAPFLGIGEAAGTTAGAVGAGAATGAAPAIDYAAGAPGASGRNAMLGLATGAAFPAGQALGAVVRQNPAAAAGVAATGGLALTSASESGAQGTQPALDPAIADLHRRDVRLAELHRQLLSAQAASRAAAAANITANQGRNTNSGAHRNAAAAAQAEQAAQAAYNEALNAAQERFRAQNRTFAEAFPMISENPFLATTLPAAVLGMLRAGGSAAATRYQNRPINTMVNAGNSNITNNQLPQAAANAAGARAALDQLNSAPPATWGNAFRNTMTSVGNTLSGPTAGGLLGAEMAMLPQQYNAMYAPPSSPEYADAMSFWRDPGRIAIRGALGAAGGISGNLFGYKGTSALGQMLPGGTNPAPAVAGLEARVKSLQQSQAPAVPAATQAQTSNLPIDFDAILRDIGGAVRNVRGPRGSNPAAPGLSYNPSMDSSALFRSEISDHLRSGNVLSGFNVSEFRRRAVQTAEANGGAAADVPSVEVFRRTLQRLETLIREQGLTPAQAAQRLSRENRRGGFENFAIPLAAGGAAAAHHSASQPRGDDGRFQPLQ